MRTFKEVIDLWPSVDELAEDLGKKPNTVRKWRVRNSVPADEWMRLIQSARARGIERVNADALAKIASSH
jgi:uncharacterized protein YjcR